MFSNSELTIVKKQLKYMKNNKKWKESVEMNIKCISPFHILVVTWWFDQVLIAHKPAIHDMLLKSTELGSEKSKSQHLSTDSKDMSYKCNKGCHDQQCVTSENWMLLSHCQILFDKSWSLSNLKNCLELRVNSWIFLFLIFSLVFIMFSI